MLRKTLAIFTTTLCLGVHGASAQTLTEPPVPTFEVVMLGYGYFPEVAYADPNWTITFYNASNSPMTATATDGSWTTGVVSPGKTVVIPLTGPDGQLMGLEYNNSMPNAATVAETLGLTDLITSLNTVDVTLDQIAASGRIEPAADAPDFLSADGKPMSDAEAAASFGAATYDTDGDGDADGYDHSVMFAESQSSDDTATATTTAGDDDGTTTTSP